MNNNSIAIIPGQPTSDALTLIIQTLLEPDMMEICTPIIYCDPKELSTECQNIGAQLTWQIIDTPTQAHAAHINIIPTTDPLETLHTHITTPNQAPQAIILGPDTTTHINNATYINENICAISLDEYEGKLKADDVKEKIKHLHHTLTRDHRITAPRIAILTADEMDITAANKALQPIISTLLEQENIQTYGVYTNTSFFENGHHTTFDAIALIANTTPLTLLTALTDKPTIIADTHTDIPTYHIPLTPDTTPDTLRQTIYTSIDTFRARTQYDQAYANPLQKLYKERPDSGEKLRFSMPRKKEE